jgi:protein N-terminal methyltransferase
VTCVRAAERLLTPFFGCGRRRRRLCAGLQYWAALPATVQTVLGGYERVSPGDVRESDAFLRSLLPLDDADAAAALRPLVAADCGAGVGRVTQHLLLRHFDEVDVFEPVKHFLDSAEATIGRAPEPAAGEPQRAVNFICQPLEEFTPEKGRYDVIWAQARAAGVFDCACGACCTSVWAR